MNCKATNKIVKITAVKKKSNMNDQYTLDILIGIGSI